MRKRLALRLLTLLLVFLLFSASIMIISAAACRRKRSRWDEEENELIIESLQELSSEISDLPNEAFDNPCRARCQRKVLRIKVCVMIWQVKVGAYRGALNKLKNDIKEKIERRIVDPWKGILIEKVEHIIELLENLLCRDWKPPTIVTVLRHPETPNYDEPVTVIAQVIDEQSGVKSVILSYQVDSSDWINTTMSIIDGLYIAEIPPLPYDSAVDYKIYAYDWACNLAVLETYSYVVVDSYPPLISYVDRIPASPNYNQNVTIFANVTEPPEASGVKNVTLLYRTDSEWQPVEMTLDQLYIGIIPAFPSETVVQYRVRAFDYADNWATSGIYSYTVGAPPPNLPPVAIFSESAETVLTGVVIHFDASGSYDPDGDIVSCFWTFGDGTNATGVTTDHAYADDGVYIVILTITDDDGLTDTAISIKTVLNRPPVASFTVSATTVHTEETVHFDASGSEDPDGLVIYYVWNFGDGTSGAGVSVSRDYEDNGVYEVALTVIDDDGATSFTSAVVTVLNRPPVALFAENVTTVKENEVIHFDASESFDPDGSIVNYFWDFGDGTDATGVVVDHAYASSGTFTVTLRVTDDDAAVDFASSTKTVLPLVPPNQPPVALFTESAETVDTDEVITFNASISYDPDGDIVSYFWDFGDGTNATDVTVDHAYADEGNYTVTLTVTDDDEALSSTSATKTVEAPAAGWPLALLAAIGLGLGALTATVLYGLYRRRKRGGSAANPGNRRKTVVTLYVPAKILSRFELKPLKRRKS